MAVVRSLLLIALLACDAPVQQIGLPPHQVAELDPAWYPDLTLTRQSYAEQACAVKPVQNSQVPCTGAAAPRANERFDCAATFLYLDARGVELRGCCVPYHAVATPTVTDRVYFFECPM